MSMVVKRFDEIHERYRPFFQDSGFKLAKKWTRMGRAVDYESDVLDVCLATDYLGYMEVSLSPHLCKDRYRWTGCSDVRAWVLKEPVYRGPEESTPESTVRNTIEDLEFLKDRLEEVRELFSPARYRAFETDLKGKIHESCAEWGGGFKGGEFVWPYTGEKGQDPLVPLLEGPGPKEPIPPRPHGLVRLVERLKRLLSRL